MKSEKFVEKIKSYAFVSFIIPLIAINTCFLIYKFLGNFDTLLYPNLNWDKNEHSYTYTEFANAEINPKEYKILNCPKYKFNKYFITIDNESFLKVDDNKIMLENLGSNNKIKSVVIKIRDEKVLNYNCLKNYHFSYDKCNAY